MLARFSLVLALALAGLPLGALARRPPVTVDLTGAWDDADSRAAAAALSTELLGSRWRTATRRLPRQPALELRPLRNRTIPLNLDLFNRLLGEGLARGGLRTGPSAEACVSLALAG